MNYKNEIYLATVCLEKNRWTTRLPSIKVSDYLDKIMAAGFDGIELWENHALLADEDELAKLIDSSSRIKLLNTYCLGDKGHETSRDASLAMAKRLAVEGIKFNFGRDFDDLKGCVERIDDWLRGFPKDSRLLCEFHNGFNLSYENIAEALGYTESMSTRVEAISHAFSMDSAAMAGQFSYFGERIRHIHVQYIWDTRDEAADVIQALRDRGFQGSFSIEFTNGVKEEDADVEDILDNAIRDMSFLRRCIGDQD